MPDDFTAPLGLNWDKGPKRYRRIWPLPLGLFIVLALGLGGWIGLTKDPQGGEPVARIAIPKIAAQAAPAAVAAPTAPAPEPDDPSGQIIIRDP